MKWLYTPTPDNKARFTLGVDRGTKPLLCFGINPSTAEPDNLDNTLKSVERIANRHNYDSWIMLNVYPQRATNPNDMHVEHDKNLHKQNLREFKEIIKAGDAHILAAWGTLIEKRPYLKDCLLDLIELTKEHNATWYRIGKVSKAGHPHHPLYLSNKERLKKFNIEKYVKSLI